MADYTREQIIDLLGDEAQSVPGRILVHRGAHIVIAELAPSGALTVTAEGAAILASIPVKKAPKGKQVGS